MRRLLLLALPALAIGCAPTSRPAASRVAPPPPAASLPPPPRAADWADWPLTPGSWSYARVERGTAATFGQIGSVAIALLRCDVPNRRLFLSRAGAAATPFTVRTTSLTRQLPTGAAGGEPPYAAAVLPAGDPLLDAIAFSRGKFTLEQAGTAPLVLPTWAEIGRVIEDCR